MAGTELEKANISWSQLWDLVQYLTDLATSLDSFLRVYPAAGVHFRETHFITR